MIINQINVIKTILSKTHLDILVNIPVVYLYGVHQKINYNIICINEMSKISISALHEKKQETKRKMKP